MIVFGARMYGRVDEVPGLFYVATQFFHIYYLPLVPMGSRLVLASDSKNPLVMPIAFSFKSLAIAWLRAFMAFLVLLFGCLALVIALESHPVRRAGWWPFALAAAAVALVWAYTYFGKPFRRASYKRALLIAERARAPFELK